MPMPNQRSQPSLLAEQQQQQKRVIGIVLKLNALAKVSGLTGIAEAIGWVINLSSSTKALSQHQVDQDCCTQLLESYFAAISNGLKQLYLNWPQTLAVAAQPFLIAVRTVYILCRNLEATQSADWCGIEYAHTASDMAVKAGFLEHFASVTSQVLLTLQPLQQTAGVSAHQYTEKHDEVVRLGALLLDLWSDLLRSWPSPKLSHSSFQPTVEPAASLALTFIRVLLAQLANPSSCNSSSNRDQSSFTSDSSNGDCVSRGWRASWEVSLSMSSTLMTAVYDDFRAARISCSSSAAAGASAALASSAVQVMLLLGLAVAAALVHQQQPAGVVAAAQVPLQVEEQQQQHGHLRLLAALGFTTLSLNPELGKLAGAAFLSPHTAHLFIVVVEYVYRSEQYQQEQKNEAAGSSDAAGAAADDLLQQLALPVLHTIKDVMLLLPDTVADVLSTLCAFNAVLRPAYQLWNLQQQQEIWQWVLQPLYEKVCAVVHQASQQDETSAGSGSSREEPSMLLMSAWVVMLEWTFVHGSSSVPVLSKQLKNIIMQQPVTTLSALETLIRLFDTKQQSSSMTSRIVAAVLEGLRHSGHCSVAYDIMAQPHVQQQLCSFICSHLKLLMVPNTETQTDVVSEQQRLALAAFVQELRLITNMLGAHHIAQMALNDQPVQQLEAAGCLEQRLQQLLLTSWPMDCWLALLGKAMFASAESLLQQLRLSQGPVALSAAVSVWSANLPVAIDILEDDKVTTVEAVSGCKQQLHTLRQLLVNAEAAIADGTCDEVMQQQLLAQLQQCGSSICAALPVKFCCNNPACVNLTQLCEKQLVAGKGSRCSGCKVARYCSRDCQLKHWKEHRKTCKRLQAEADGKSTPDKQR